MEFSPFKIEQVVLKNTNLQERAIRLIYSFQTIITSSLTLRIKTTLSRNILFLTLRRPYVVQSYTQMQSYKCKMHMQFSKKSALFHLDDNGSIVVTPPSLEPTTSRIPVQRSTTKPKVRTQARGRHYTPPFLESLVFSSTRHHRLLPNQSPGRASQPHRPLNSQCRTTLGCHALTCV